MLILRGDLINLTGYVISTIDYVLPRKINKTTRALAKKARTKSVHGQVYVPSPIICLNDVTPFSHLSQLSDYIILHFKYRTMEIE